MKIKFSSFLMFFSLVAFLFSAVCCTEPEPDEPNPDNGGEEVIPGEATYATVVLENEKGYEVKQTITVEEDWALSNSISWCFITPIKGESGDVEFTFTAGSLNKDIMERTGVFKINEDSYYVVQRGVTTLSIHGNDEVAAYGAEYIEIATSGTFPIAEVEVSTDVSWLKFSEAVNVSDSVLLEDGRTCSRYMESVIRLSVEEDNPTDGLRYGKVMITAGEQKYVVDVTQLKAVSSPVDFSRDFYRASVVFKGTGSWCGNCPVMSKAISDASEATDGRLIAVSCYDAGSYQELYWSGCDEIFTYYGLLGFPQGFFNGYATLNNFALDAQTKLLCDMVQEAVTYYPASVIMSAEARLSGDVITVDVDMVSRRENDYKVMVYILENGIVTTQEDYYGVIENPDSYTHNHVLKGALSEDYIAGGDAVSLPVGELVSKTFTGALPSGVVNADNLDILICVTYPGTHDSSLPRIENAAYRDYGFIIDSAVLCPIDGSVDFTYEK